MLINRLRKKPGIAVVTPESTEDLWVLRRILKNGDIITSQTKRVIKKEKEFELAENKFGKQCEVSVYKKRFEIC